MRIPILVAAPPAMQKSGSIPLPQGTFKLEVIGMNDSKLEINGLEVRDGMVIEGPLDIIVQRVEPAVDKSITIFAHKVGK